MNNFLRILAPSLAQFHYSIAKYFEVFARYHRQPKYDDKNVETSTAVRVKARLHMRFLMRFLARFRVQNAPYPTLHECFFREASRGLERKLSHIISRHPSFRFLLTWRYFVAELRDYKPVRGRLWQVLYAKSHENRIEIS